jgi:hypothetical protein
MGGTARVLDRKAAAVREAIRGASDAETLYRKDIASHYLRPVTRRKSTASGFRAVAARQRHSAHLPRRRARRSLTVLTPPAGPSAGVGITRWR